MVRTAVTLEVANAINSSFHELDKNIRYTKNILKELPEIIEWENIRGIYFYSLN